MENNQIPVFESASSLLRCFSWNTKGAMYWSGADLLAPVPSGSWLSTVNSLVPFVSAIDIASCASFGKKHRAI